MNHSTLTIEEVEQAFTDWRTNKSGNPPVTSHSNLHISSLFN